MMRDVGLIAAGLGIAGGVYVILITPSWLFTGMNRSCLWEVRDEIFAARMRGRLSDVPAVDALLGRLENAIVLMPNLTPGMGWWLLRRSGVDERTAPRMFLEEIELDELKPHQQALVVAWIHETRRILIRQYMTGSWPALAFYVVVERHALRTVLSRARWQRFVSDVERIDTEELERIIDSTTRQVTGTERRQRDDLIAAH